MKMRLGGQRPANTWNDMGPDPFDTSPAVEYRVAGQTGRRSLLMGLGLSAFMLPAWVAAAQTRQPSDEPWIIQPPVPGKDGAMTLVHIWAQPDGKTVISEETLVLSMNGDTLLEQPAETVALRVMPPNMKFDWHRASRPRLVATIQGRSRLTLRDGTERIVQPGSLMLVENTTGEGHRGEFGIDGEYVVTFDVGLPKAK